MSEFFPDNMTSPRYAAAAVRYLKRIGRAGARIGVEVGFLPVDAHAGLRDGLPDAVFAGATFTLEILRARKDPAELEILRQASERVVDAMLAVFAAHGAGSTKRELVEALRCQEQRRGLKVEYCLANIGADFNRAPSEQVWRPGEVLALDSGGNYRGYIGDVCRMAVAGTPDAELEELLAEVDAVQQAARQSVRPGILGQEIFAGPGRWWRARPTAAPLEFVAHGMGIVSQEAPWLTDSCSVPYPAHHAERPLEAGMVISIETTLKHPRRGFIKLEDTVAVTATGHEAFGDRGRVWNIAGA